MKRYLYLNILLLLLVIGCNGGASKTDVVGLYVANHKYGIDTIDMRADGTYVHYFKGNGQREFTDIGTWEFENHGKDLGVTLNKFVFRMPGYGRGTPAYWNVAIEKSLFGKVKLCIDPDLYYYYTKQTKS